MRSDRSTSRTPNDRMNRYLQRIQQLVGNKHRSPSPIQARIFRQPQISSLDHYLKYQLTFKILTGFLQKNKQKHMNYFFNAIRTHQSRHSETVYRFVPIQREKCTHNDAHLNSTNSYRMTNSKNNVMSHTKASINVDHDIAIKLVVSALKNIFRRRISSLIKFLTSITVEDITIGPMSKSFTDQHSEGTRLLGALLNRMQLKNIATAYSNIKVTAVYNLTRITSKTHSSIRVIDKSNAVILALRIQYKLKKLMIFSYTQIKMEAFRKQGQLQLEQEYHQGSIRRVITLANAMNRVHRFFVIYTFISISKAIASKIKKDAHIKTLTDSNYSNILQVKAINFKNVIVRVLARKKYEVLVRFNSTDEKFVIKEKKRFFLVCNVIVSLCSRKVFQYQSQMFIKIKNIYLKSLKQGSEIAFSKTVSKNRMVVEQVKIFIFSIKRVVQILERVNYQFKESFTVVKNYSNRAGKIEKVANIYHKQMTVYCWKRLKGNHRLLKLMDYLQTCQFNVKLNAFIRIVQYGRNEYIRKKLEVLGKLERRRVCDIIHGYTMMKMSSRRSTLLSTSSRRSSPDNSLTTQTAQFLQHKQQGQEQLESKFNRIKDIIYTKNKNLGDSMKTSNYNS